MRAKFVQFFVQSEAGRISRDFKQHAAGFAEINGMKISAIDYWRDVVAKIDETFAPMELFGFVLRSKCNVMHRTSRNAAHRGVGLTQQIDDSAGSRIISRDKAESISRFVSQMIAEGFGE